MLHSLCDDERDGDVTQRFMLSKLRVPENFANIRETPPVLQKKLVGLGDLTVYLEPEHRLACGLAVESGGC